MQEVVPGCIVDPGLNANYRRGRTKRQLIVDHFTVGRDSRALIRDRGLAAFLLPKIGQPFQFAPADAVTSHACEWNDEGCGLEFERMNWGEPLTPDQIHWGGVITRWQRDRYGIPGVLWDTFRLQIGDPYRGSVNHGSLVHRACDQHTDGITQADFAAMMGGTEEDDMKGVFIKKANSPYVFYLFGNSKSYVPTQEVMSGLAYVGQAIDDKAHVVADSFFDAIPDAPRATAGTPGAPAPIDTAAIAKAVNDDAARRLAS